MRLGWVSVLKLGAFGFIILDAIGLIAIFYLGRGYDLFWLSVILILLILLVIVFLVPRIASKKVEKELGI